MRSLYTILLCHFSGISSLYLNGQEIMRSARGSAARRQFRYPTGAQEATVRHVPAPHPDHEPTLVDLVIQATQLLSRLPDQPGDHSRLVMIADDGQISSYVNGLPVDLTNEPGPLPDNVGPQFIYLASQADIECSAVS